MYLLACLIIDMITKTIFFNLYEGSSPFKNIKENSQKKEVRNKSYLTL